MQNTPNISGKIDAAIDKLMDETALKVVLDNLDQASAGQFVEMLKDDKYEVAAEFLKSKIPNLNELFQDEYTHQAQIITGKIKNHKN